MTRGREIDDCFEPHPIGNIGGVMGDGGVLEDLDNSSAFDRHRRAWRTA